jgi:hypothetical protein
MDGVSVFLPGLNVAGLHLSADLITLQDEPPSVLVGILLERDHVTLFDEDLGTCRSISGPRPTQISRAGWTPEENRGYSQRRDQNGTLAIARSRITIDPSMADYSFGLLIHDTITKRTRTLATIGANRRRAFVAD